MVFYSTLSPQKCTKLNTEKQHAQGHLGSNLTPERENRNFRKTGITNSTKQLSPTAQNGYHQQHKTVITNSTKPLCRPRGHLSWQSHACWCHCKIHQKSYRKKNEGWGHIWPRVAVWGLRTQCFKLVRMSLWRCFQNKSRRVTSWDLGDRGLGHLGQACSAFYVVRTASA